MVNSATPKQQPKTIPIKRNLSDNRDWTDVHGSSEVYPNGTDVWKLYNLASDVGSTSRYFA
ncbi:MAG: hypothetical protein WAM14_20790 [Candidatus Nitrosopolaris sp.]